MNLHERKIKIIQQVINEQDEKVIEEIENKIAAIEYDKDSHQKVIGYNAKRNPVIKSDFVTMIKHSLLAVDHGEWISLEELEERSEAW